MRELAQVALNAYGMPGANYKIIRQAGNTLFRVFESDPVTTDTDLFVPGQYMLRIHQRGYQSTDALDLELKWLAAMRRDADLPVPEPVPALNGSLLTQVSVPRIPDERNCSLLRWVKGRFITSGIRSHHYQAQGNMMARLHDFAAAWNSPPELTKRKYDWEGLFRDDLEEGIPASGAWSLLPLEYREPYELVAGRVKQVMEEMGKAPNVYGLIHADCGLDANVLFWGHPAEARPIDFDDSGFGYYMYDLSLALEHCQEDAALQQYRDALLKGYTEVRSVPEEQLNHLDLFLSAYHVFSSLWAAAMTTLYPQHREELFERMARAAKLVRLYLDSH